MVVYYTFVLTKTKTFIMIYTFNNLEQDAKWKAIYTYCKHMKCFGLENKVDSFLSNSKSVKFNANGYLVLNTISK
mgnify:CR=1 FL=1